MRTNEDIERYLIQLGVQYDTLKEGMWVVRENDTNLVVMHSPPVTVFRVKLAALPNLNNTELFRAVLEINATEMVSGAFGIEGTDLVIIATLQSENLDYNEVRESVESILLAVRSHYPKLSKFLKPSEKAA